MDIPLALEHFDAAERLRPELAERFHLHRGRMQAAMFGVHVEVLGAAARRADELARASGRDDLASYAAWGAGYHAANLGDSTLALDHFARAWQTAYAQGDPVVGWLPANGAAHVATELFLDPATGRGWCRKALAQPRFAAFAFPHEAMADQLVRAMAAMGELDDAVRAASSLPAEALAHRVLPFYRGEWEEAARTAALDLERERGTGNRHEVLFHSRRLADALTAMGERDPRPRRRGAGGRTADRGGRAAGAERGVAAGPARTAVRGRRPGDGPGPPRAVCGGRHRRRLGGAAR
jgi:hypothetical protein